MGAVTVIYIDCDTVSKYKLGNAVGKTTSLSVGVCYNHVPHPHPRAGLGDQMGPQGNPSVSLTWQGDTLAKGQNEVGVCGPSMGTLPQTTSTLKQVALGKPTSVAI